MWGWRQLREWRREANSVAKAGGGVIERLSGTPWKG